MSTPRTRNVVTAVIGILLIAGVAWVARQNRLSKNVPNLPQDEPYQEEQTQDVLPSQPEQPAPEHTILGTLKISDNLKKGNLMLLTDDKTIYIYTSRDYSALLEKQVSVTYEGTPEDFKLGEITAQ